MYKLQLRMQTSIYLRFVNILKNPLVNREHSDDDDDDVISPAPSLHCAVHMSAD